MAVAADGEACARCDAAYAGLVELETQRRGLEAAARRGDLEARAELAALRPRLSRQAVLAADLDAAADLAAVAPGRGGGTRGTTERRMMALAERRLALAREVEAHVRGVVAACRAIEENAEDFARAGLDAPAITAELARFGDRLCFYLDSMLDFVTGARGLAGHPAYRKLSEVLLDGDAILKLYRRSAGACRADPPAA